VATKLAFTTLRGDGGRPLFWKNHWQRLAKSWQYFGHTSLDGHDSLYEKICLELAPEDCIIRIDLLSDGLFQLTKRELSCRDDDQGIRLKLSQEKLKDRAVPSWLKCGDYSKQLEKRNTLQKNGFEDYLFLDSNDCVAESTVSNIIWAKGEKFFTPKASAFFLQGLSVDMLLENFSKQFECNNYLLDSLLGCDAAWLINAVTGPRQILSIDDHTFSRSIPKLDLDQLYWQLVKMDRTARDE
tara:strand:+ start:2030 stop:2752 length:723 start_codon:yes stop_codon:yes gene_type:complete